MEDKNTNRDLTDFKKSIRHINEATKSLPIYLQDIEINDDGNLLYPILANYEAKIKEEVLPMLMEILEIDADSDVDIIFVETKGINRNFFKEREEDEISYTVRIRYNENFDLVVIFHKIEKED